MTNERMKERVRMEGINEYLLDTPIASLPKGSVEEFSEHDYWWAEYSNGITWMFPNEVFYKAKNNKFLGCECLFTIVATLDGVIYKVLFRFIATPVAVMDQFRDDAVNYLGERYRRTPKVKKVSEFETLYIWDGDFGNAIAHLHLHGVDVIYTSSMLRPKKQSFLSRLFGGCW